MPPLVRTTVSGVGGKFPSREVGTQAGLSLNTFGLKALHGIRGDELAPILQEAMAPALAQAYEEWPVETGASRDSIEVVTYDIGPTYARVVLQAGGPKLIEDPRNESKKDYAPFIEYNGTATVGPGTMTHAVFANLDQMRAKIREGVVELLRRRLNA